MRFYGKYGECTMGLDYKNKYVKILTGIVQHYNPSKYWRMREFVISENSGKVLNKVIKYWYLYRIKKWTHSIMRVWEPILDLERDLKAFLNFHMD